MMNTIIMPMIRTIRPESRTAIGMSMPGCDIPIRTFRTAIIYIRIDAAGRPSRRDLTPVLLIHAEWDRDTPAYMAQTLFPLPVNAPMKRYVQLGEGTHTIVMEKSRPQLFRAVQSFFEERSRT
jgi:alpha-beta hydrolase superfamily lysophospholipase